MLHKYLGSRPAFSFSGAAGRAQNERDSQRLVNELGSNYQTYHDELAETLKAAGGLKARAEFWSNGMIDLARFVAHGAEFDRVVHAEVFLRWCRGKVRGRDDSLGKTSDRLLGPDRALLAVGEVVADEDYERPASMPAWK